MLLTSPYIILNLKTYETATGTNAVHLSHIAATVNARFHGTIAVCPPTPNLADIANNTDIPLIAQHIDPYEPGKHTGSVTAQSIAQYAIGTLINHSEKRLSFEDIQKNIDLCHKNNLLSVCIAKDSEEIKHLLPFKPDYVAFEIPELVGTGTSISQAEPEAITKDLQLVREHNPDLPFLCGAGVSTKDDVKAALDLGADGVVLASAFAKADNPQAFLEELISF